MTARARARAFNTVNPAVPASGGTNSPFSPTFRPATSITTTGFTLNWDLPPSTVDGSDLTGGNALTGLEVFYAVSPTDPTPGGGTPITIASPSLTTRAVTGMTTGTTYRIIIRAVNAFGPSDVSNIFIVTTA